MKNGNPTGDDDEIRPEYHSWFAVTELRDKPATKGYNSARINWLPVAKFTGVVPSAMPQTTEMFMRAFTAVIERCPDTGLFVGYVPGFPGAHSQGETLDELQRNLAEVIGMLLQDGEPPLESEFIGTQKVQVV